MKLFGVTAGQFLKVGVIALLFLFLAKELTARVDIPGLSALVERA